MSSSGSRRTSVQSVHLTGTETGLSAALQGAIPNKLPSSFPSAAQRATRRPSLFTASPTSPITADDFDLIAPQNRLTPTASRRPSQVTQEPVNANHAGDVITIDHLRALVDRQSSALKYYQTKYPHVEQSHFYNQLTPDQSGSAQFEMKNWIYLSSLLRAYDEQLQEKESQLQSIQLDIGDIKKQTTVMIDENERLRQNAHERVSLEAKFKASQQESAQLQQRLRHLTQQYESAIQADKSQQALQAQVAALEAEILSMRQQSHSDPNELNNQVRTLRQSNGSLSHRVRLLENELSDTRTTATQLDQTVKTYQAQAHRAQLQVAEYQQQLAKQQTQVEDYKRIAARLGISLETIRLAQAVQSSSSSVVNISAMESPVEQAVLQLQQQNSVLEVKLRESRLSLHQLVAEREVLQQQVKRLQQQFEKAQQQSVQIRQQQETFENARLLAVQEVKRLRDELQTAREALLRQQETSQNENETLMSAMQQKLRVLNAQFENEQARLLSQIEDLQQSRRELQTEVSNALRQQRATEGQLKQVYDAWTFGERRKQKVLPAALSASAYKVVESTQTESPEPASISSFANRQQQQHWLYDVPKELPVTTVTSGISSKYSHLFRKID